VLFRYNGQDNYSVLAIKYSQKCSAEFDLKPGAHYAALVTRLPDNKTAMCEFKTGKLQSNYVFTQKIWTISVFSPSELDKLYLKAKKLAKTEGLYKFKKFYRCKPKEYWAELQDNTMQPYVKDQGGHLESPINEELRGLFFSTKTFDGGRPSQSPFGDTCVRIDSGKLLDPDKINMYFADFFCNWNG
jgi:hypothetical protein